MTEPPRTLQERLRELTCDGYDGRYWTTQKDQAMHEAAGALDAQSQLLAEAREALEPFAQKLSNFEDDGDTPPIGKRKFIEMNMPVKSLRKASAVLAKLKAASGEG